MRETDKIHPLTTPYTEGLGVDFGCWDSPHPRASVLVDREGVTSRLFGKTHEVHVRNVDAGFADWPDARFDWAYSSHMIEHLRDPFAFLAECRRIVKPGGYVIVAGPHRDWYWPNGHPDANPDHLPYNWRLDERVVSKWCEAAGLRVVEAMELPRPDNWSFLVVAKRI